MARVPQPIPGPGGQLPSLAAERTVCSQAHASRPGYGGPPLLQAGTQHPSAPERPGDSARWKLITAGNKPEPELGLILREARGSPAAPVVAGPLQSLRVRPARCVLHSGQEVAVRVRAGRHCPRDPSHSCPLKGRPGSQGQVWGQARGGWRAGAAVGTEAEGGCSGDRGERPGRPAGLCGKHGGGRL